MNNNFFEITSKEILAVASILGLGLFLFILSLHVRPSMPDDAFIYLRFVRNLATSGEWAFNLGEPVNSTTSPLYVLVLVGLYRMGFSSEYSLVVAFWLGLWLTLIAIYLGTRRAWGHVLALTAASVLVLWPGLLLAAGMESSIFLAAITWGALAYQRDRYVLVGVLAGLVALARPEGVAFLAILLLAERWEKKSLNRSFWIVCAAGLVIAPWLVYSQLHFGSIVSYSAKLKAVQAATGWQGNWLISWLQQLPLPWMVFSLAAVGFVSAWRSYSQQNEKFLFLVICFGLVQVVGYHFLKAPVDYFWYYVPGNFSVGLAAISGAVVVGKLALRKVESQKFRCLVNSAGLVFLALGVMVYSLGAWTHSGKPYRMSSDYIDAAEWLRKNASPNSLVACDEIGYVGFYSGLPVRDMLGLIEPSALTPLKKRQWDWWFAKAPLPQFVILHTGQPWPGEPTLTAMSNLRDWVWPVESYNEFFGRYNKVHSTGAVDIYELRQ